MNALTNCSAFVIESIYIVYGGSKVTIRNRVQRASRQGGDILVK